MLSVVNKIYIFPCVLSRGTMIISFYGRKTILLCYLKFSHNNNNFTYYILSVKTRYIFLIRSIIKLYLYLSTYFVISY